MLYGGDYNIWTPKWQVEGLVDWQMPDEGTSLRLSAADHRFQEKILGLNAARLYGIDVPAECSAGCFGVLGCRRGAR